MSPVTRTRRDGSLPPARHRAVQPVPVVWLTLVWVALWQNLSVLNVVSGVVVAVLVCLVFPLPPLRTPMRVRPVALGGVVLRFLLDVVMASVQVVRVTVLPGRISNAIIAVDLRTPSDLVLTIVGQMLSLIPGSLLIEARRSTHTIYLHVLDVEDVAAADAFRERVLELEQRVVHALGIRIPPDVPDEGGHR